MSCLVLLGLLWNATKQHAILGQILIMTCGLAAHMEEALITPNVERTLLAASGRPAIRLPRLLVFPVRTFEGRFWLAWYFKDPREPSFFAYDGVGGHVDPCGRHHYFPAPGSGGTNRVEAAPRESDARYRAFRRRQDIVAAMSADWSEMQSLVGKRVHRQHRTAAPRLDGRLYPRCRPHGRPGGHQRGHSLPNRPLNWSTGSLDSTARSAGPTHGPCPSSISEIVSGSGSDITGAQSRPRPSPRPAISNWSGSTRSWWDGNSG